MDTSTPAPASGSTRAPAWKDPGILRYDPDGLPVYRSGKVPAHLATRSQLRSDDLSTAGLSPAGRLHYNPYHRICALYDRRAARPVRQLNDAQRAALAAGRLLAGTQPCIRCGTRTRWRSEDADYFGGAVCKPCLPAAEQAVIDRQIERAERDHQAMERMIAADRQAAARWAREVLADPRSVILDLETTGLNQERTDYAVEIAVLTAAGDVLLDQRLNPGVPIPGEASAVHDIRDQDIADAPTFAEVLPRLSQVLAGRRVIIYNAAFDLGILRNELRRHRDACGTGPTMPGDAECAMEQYAAWCGEWSVYHGSYRWQRLGGPHKGSGDCQAVIAVLQEMADSSEP
ncbi:exonuclease domain-containing protein [Streptomyces xiamenensis]|uniref:exonuclease domain-containing protein n=1 Tax=Streptomyces xiamenensis TaxID=408015 RepID=UPI0035DC53EB